MLYAGLAGKNAGNIPTKVNGALASTNVHPLVMVYATVAADTREMVTTNWRGRWRPNNDATGTDWSGNWTSGRDANCPMAFRGLFGPPFAPRSQRNFLVRR